MYPVLFEFGSITVFSLWFFVAVGFITGSLLFVHLAKRHRVRIQLLTENSVILFLFPLLVSRIVFIVFHQEYFFRNFSFTSFLNFFSVWDKGLSFWGALAGWVAGIIFLAASRNESSQRIFDIFIPALFAGMFFGNIGTLLDSINYGTQTSLPWGITIRSANVKYITPIHPTQIYAALYTGVLAFVLLVLLKRMRNLGSAILPGFIAELGIFCFCFFKFFEEFVRGDEVARLFGIRLPQIAALAGFLIAGYWLFLRYTNRAGGDPGKIFQTFIREKIIARLPSSKKHADTTQCAEYPARRYA